MHKGMYQKKSGKKSGLQPNPPRTPSPRFGIVSRKDKEAAAFEAPSQTKEEFSGNDTSRHPKVFKLGPKLGYQ